MMNRRKFLKLLGLAPLAPTVVSFGTGVWGPPVQKLCFNGIPIRLVDSMTGPRHIMTATEVAMRHEEMMLKLRPTLDRMNHELLHNGYAAHKSVLARLINPNEGEVYGRSPSEEATEDIETMQEALGKIPKLGEGRPVFYAKPEVAEAEGWIESMNRGTERQILASTGYHPEETP